MPRNAQGVYSLPAGNPVVPGTLIETTWANPTMSDIAAALTASLPRDGSAPMTGDLQLNGSAPATGRSAVSKDYVTSFMATATGMPVGSVMAYAGNVPPGGFLECDGQAVSRTTYSALFGVISTIYGSGNGVDTFNLPDMRDEFIRGKSAARAVGNKQVASLASHTHPASDPGHTHTQAAHTHPVTTVAHTHVVTDPGHTHSGTYFKTNTSGDTIATTPGSDGADGSIPSSTTGVSIASAAPTGTAGATTAVNNSATTGLTIGATGDAETRPQNIAQIYVIKAVNDAGPITGIAGVTTSDASMISVDNTNPALPDLIIHSNVAFGIVKLDANAKVPQSLVDTSTFQYLGPWDASGGQNPSQALPSEVFANGDLYQISVGGTIQLYDAAGTLSSTNVVSTDQIVFVTGSTVGNPTGWYFQPTTAITGITAVAVSFSPAGSIGAVNVQAAIEEVAAEAAPLTHVGAGGAQHANVVAAGAAGFMTGADKTKLDGIEANAQVNTVQSVNTKTGVVTLTAADVGALTQAGADSLYVNVSGDTMSGGLKVGGTGLTFPDNTVQSTAAVAAGAGSAFRASNNASQTLTTGVAAKVLFQSEDFDVDASYDTTLARFTPKVDGPYQVNAQVLVGNGTRSLLTVSVYKNGASVQAFRGRVDATIAQNTGISTVVNMNGTTDYLEIFCQQNTGGNLSMITPDTWFSAAKVG